MISKPIFESITVHADNIFKTINTSKNRAEYNGTYFCCSVSGQTLTMHSSSDFSIDDVIEDTYTNTGTGDLQGCACRRVGAQTIIGASFYWDTSGVGESKCVWLISTDGGSTWTGSETVSGKTGLSSILTVDVAYIDSKKWVLVADTGGLDEMYLIADDVSTFTSMGSGAGSGLGDYVCPGEIYDDEYWWAIFTGSDQTWWVKSYDGSSQTTEYTITNVTTPTHLNWANQYYIQSGANHYIITRDFILSKKGSNDWSEKTGSDADTAVVATVNSSNEYELAYALFDDYLWKVLPHDALVRIQVWSGTAYCGMDDWFSTGTAIYQYNPTGDTLPTIVAEVIYEINKTPIINLTAFFDPFEDQYLMLNDPRGVEFAEAFVFKVPDSVLPYPYSFKHPYELDMNKPYTASYTAQSGDTIMEDWVANNCDFIYDGGNIVGSATTLNADFDNAKNSAINKMICDRFGYYSAIRPNLELFHANTFAASGKTLTTGKILKFVPRTPQEFKVSLVRIWGAVGTTPSVGQGEAGYGYFEDWYPAINTTAELDNIRDSILSKYNVKITEYKIDCAGAEGPFYLGQTLTFSYSPLSIVSETGYIYKYKYNAKADRYTLYVKDAYYLPLVDTTIDNLRNEITRIYSELTGDYLLIADIDDTPVNGETAAPISSNWAFDHVAAADPHTVYALDSELTTHKSSSDHDGRYYTEAETDAAIDADITTHAASGDHDGRYYTETEIDALNDLILGGIPPSVVTLGTGWSTNASFGAVYQIAMSATSGYLSANFYTPVAGSFKVLFIYDKSDSGGDSESSGKLYLGYGGDGEALSNTWYNNANFDLDGMTNAGYRYYKLTTAQTLAAGDAVGFNWYPDTNNGSGNIRIRGIYLVKQ